MMVSIIAGAVAVGIVSVCAAIPFGCSIMSRRMKKKVLIPMEVVNEPETENEELMLDGVEEVVSEPQYEIEEVWSNENANRQTPRVEIRVFVSNGSSRLAEVGSQGYATASRSSSSSSSRRHEASEQNTEYRRYSLPNLAAGPAAVRQNRAKNSAVPIAVRIFNSSKEESRSCEKTKLEITVSGGYSHCSNTQFREFRNDVQDSSTPKSRGISVGPETSGKHERSSFWRRVSFNRNRPPKIATTTCRDIEVIDIDVVPVGDESRRRRADLAGSEAREDLSYRKNDSRSRSKVSAGPSRENNGTNVNRGRWELPGRFLETLRETTSIATL